jgi:GMP synthase (glutamine-hydrolysing)
MFFKNQLDKVLIIDFGSQVTKLIARRIREIGVFSEVIPFTADIDKYIDEAVKAIILSGGPASVETEGAPTIDKKIFDKGLPILGICYGQQLTCKLLEGKVSPSDEREFGKALLKFENESELFLNIVGDSTQVWMSHGDRVEALPEGFEVIATTPFAPFAAIQHKEKKIFGVQFHPEVTHTLYGTEMLRNFVLNIAGCKPEWTMHNFLELETKVLKEKIKDDIVICAVSGGVDSTVVATLLHKAIGEQVKCFFIDTGLLRKNEAEQVRAMFKDELDIPLKVVDASELFLGRLKGVSDPETKRKIIGKTFIDVFQEEAKSYDNAKYLAQGTLYSDVIESATSGVGEVIKSHHNVGGLPDSLNLQLIEPVRDIFKDEVRKLGFELGVPEKFIKRHPFPGPGLAIRIIGEIDQESITILQNIDKVYIDTLHKNNIYDEIWQAFAVLLPVKTVGVMGDGRTYERVCALRAVNSFDGMTADFYHFDYNILGEIANNIVNNVRGVNRVVYDITSKPPGTIEWE